MKNLVTRIAQFFRRHQTLVIASVAFVVLVVLIVLAFLPPEEAGQPDTGNTGTLPPSGSPSTGENIRPTTTITNYNTYVKNLPNITRTNIEATLYWTIGLNLSGQTPPTTGAVIRNNSYEQTLQNPDTKIFFTTFMVDISDIKQSYRVNSYYSPLPVSLTGLMDYATLVLCPTDSELIYGTFTCTDRIRMERGA